MIDSIFELVHYITNNPAILGWIVFGSFVYLVAFLLLMPFIAAKIPADYFGAEQKKPYAPKNLILYVVYKGLKNLIGLLFVVGGLLLLLTPGQGILGILIGSLVLEYPGKYRFQRWLIGKKPVLDGLNWLRKIGGAEPLQIQ